MQTCENQAALKWDKATPKHHTNVSLRYRQHAFAPLRLDMPWLFCSGTCPVHLPQPLAQKPTHVCPHSASVPAPPWPSELLSAMARVIDDQIALTARQWPQLVEQLRCSELDRYRGMFSLQPLHPGITPGMDDVREGEGPRQRQPGGPSAWRLHQAWLARSPVLRRQQEGAHRTVDKLLNGSDISLAVGSAPAATGLGNSGSGSGRTAGNGKSLGLQFGLWGTGRLHQRQRRNH
jgi:hypothetical protein